MARTKARSGGRVTPKVTAQSPRYTPPKPPSTKRSALWVPTSMFTALACGVAVIFANYLELLPGGAARNSYLFLGIGLLVGGFVLSTRYH